MKRFFSFLYKITLAGALAAPLVVFVWLVRKDLVLSGQVRFTYDLARPAAALTEFFPANRLSAIFSAGNGREFWQQIKQEPVYFEVRLPQKFENAEVEI